uniref:Uncharacterized protein n=1 Tax=Cucumis melo TaxID=3656 RepID=A0A9I9E8G3_CUCME
MEKKRKEKKTRINYLTTGDSDEDIEHKPWIFLMALRIFLIHSSQCKKTFNSTTYGQKNNTH